MVFTMVRAWEGVSERQWRSGANRSPLPRPSVLDAPHRGAGPEPAGETGVGKIFPRYLFKGGLRAPFVSPPRGRALPRTPSYEAGLRPPRTPRKGMLSLGLP